MRQIYCDNGSTSFPKAPGLGEAMGKHIDHNGYNISRGGYRNAYCLEGEIIEAREAICRLFHCKSAKNIIFIPGATAGLNMVLKGMLKKGDHVVTTSMEHNAVVRPLAQLEQEGVLWTRAQCDDRGCLDPEKIRELIRPETKLVLSIHGSNVCGTMIPVGEIGRICRAHKVFFCVDASQTAGSTVIDAETWNVDALIAPGHKGLMGPQGIGVMFLSQEMADEMEPVFAGGTGSASDREEMPDLLPDKFQPGTLNIPGIIGLKHAVNFIEQEGPEGIMEKKKAVTNAFIEEIRNLKGVRLIGLPAGSSRCSVVSLDFIHLDNGEAAFLLENEFGIMTRCGLHCAPYAHRTLGTFPHGTVRFSFGYFNTMDDVKSAARAVHKILKG